jgi:hypothetical protein
MTLAASTVGATATPTRNWLMTVKLFKADSPLRALNGAYRQCQ